MCCVFSGSCAFSLAVTLPGISVHLIHLVQLLSIVLSKPCSSITLVECLCRPRLNRFNYSLFWLPLHFEHNFKCDIVCVWCFLCGWLLFRTADASSAGPMSSPDVSSSSVYGLSSSEPCTSWAPQLFAWLSGILCFLIPLRLLLIYQFGDCQAQTRFNSFSNG